MTGKALRKIEEVDVSGLDLETAEDAAEAISSLVDNFNLLVVRMRQRGWVDK